MSHVAKIPVSKECFSVQGLILTGAAIHGVSEYDFSRWCVMFVGTSHLMLLRLCG
jgi:hypothetical protein